MDIKFDVIYFYITLGSLFKSGHLKVNLFKMLIFE